MKIKLLYIILALSFLLSCTKQDRENTIINQEAAIDSYISTLEPVEVVRNNGSNRVVVSAGKEGTEVAQGDSLYIRYAGYIFSRGKGSLFATNDRDVAQVNSFPLQHSPYKMKLGDTGMINGLLHGLEGVKEGEHCYIIFSAKYGFNNQVVYNIPKLSPLFFEVWVDKVIR
jgi:FKBP-type peptidyl-prolyl cis-trans isomerase